MPTSLKGKGKTLEELFDGTDIAEPSVADIQGGPTMTPEKLAKVRELVEVAAELIKELCEAIEREAATGGAR